jgi:ribosome assembly protein 1
VKGDVVFTLALHGWGFTVPTLVRSLFRLGTMPLKPPLMQRYLFEDTKYNARTGKVLKWKQQGNGGVGGSGAPMFVEYALRPLWEVYEGGTTDAAATTT